MAVHTSPPDHEKSVSLHTAANQAVQSMVFTQLIAHHMPLMGQSARQQTSNQTYLC